MGILQVFQKKQNNDSEALNTVQQSTAAGYSATAKPAATVRTVQPGGRIGAVMERMYRLIVSADLDMNSCYIECGDPEFESNTLPAKGNYDAFIRALKESVAKEDQERFSASFCRNNLIDRFSEGKGVVTELITLEGEPIEIRAERIPEKGGSSKRMRCCLFLRRASDLNDDGLAAQKAGSTKKGDAPSEEDKLLTQLFSGCYEINRAKDVLTGFKLEKGRFVKTEERLPLAHTILALIQNGTIHQQSADVYKKFCEQGFLEKKTAAGPYSVEVLLRRPSSTGYRWYQDVVFPVGTNFRIYRRDIDSYKKEAVTEQQAEENEKFFEYNRTMLRTVASLVEFRNAESGDHLAHVNEITRVLLEDIAERSPKYELTKPKIRLYTEASTMHDIGKVTIADSILNKPGKLDENERKLMEQHTTNGATIIERMEADKKEELYELCRDIALHHHERWDGKGYPEGLKGDDISIGAQAVSIADAFDALASKRAYKDPVSYDEAYRMIQDGKCGAFNPRLLESLRNCLPKIKAIYEKEQNGEE